jgi:CHAT domain-containing protein
VRSDAPLQPLPGAEAEAGAIARLYGHHIRLTGPEVTRDRFLSELPASDVLHFAGHAQPNRQRPELSRLYLAPSPSDPSGDLFARDIEELSLKRTRLVVLAACESALGSAVRGEGVLGLARGFLYAGVPQVVATLWRIDDRASVALFEAFHSNVARGLEPPDALRAAQLAVMHAGSAAIPVADWAAPIVIGRSSR